MSVSQKVLIIDDSPPIHSLIRARLAAEPVELLDAHGGEEGIRLARERQPDLILLDIEMPGPAGLEVCRQLKADPLTATVPIVFLGGSTATHEKLLGLELGAVDYVAKPFDGSELRARVRSALRTKYLMDLLSARAQIDGVTGLWNRAYLNQRLDQEISMARRHGHPLGLVLADVDHFVAVNQAHGHWRGDAVLRAIGGMMIDTSRREDVICRFGGEEFAILTPGVPAEGAAVLAHRIAATLKTDPPLIGALAVAVSMSFGVASLSTTDTAETFIAAATLALRQAKQDGCGRVVLASDMAAA